MKRAGKILVVEDERIVARELQQTLTAMGYDVPVTVATAEDALRVAGEWDCDLALMDIRIVGAHDGIHVATELRRVHDLPCVFVTAYSDEGTLERAMLADPFGYLIKPVSDTELRSAVEVALQRRKTERERDLCTSLLEATLRSIPEGVIASDLHGTITSANPRALVLLGVAQEGADEPALVGRGLAEVFATTTEVPRGTVLRGATAGAVELRGSITPLTDDRGNVIGAVAVFNDHA